jgi:hypothetical protein
MIRSLHTLIVFSLAACSLQAVSIVSVSVPQESQDFGNNDSYPSRDNIWTSSPVETMIGIGHIVDISETVLAADIQPLTRLGVLHSHKYDSPYAPVPSTIVTYVFDSAAVINGLEILQHMNGVTRVEGFVGNELGSMSSIGSAFGSAGDVHGHEMFTEGESHLFTFNNALAGTIFQFRITQTSLEDGYALHRAFPLLPDGSRILAAPDSGSTAPMLFLGFAGMLSASFFRRK